MHATLLLGFTLLQIVSDSSRTTIPRLDAEVRIDGVLDDAVWQQAARLTDFHQYEPVDGRPATERTEVMVWYAPDAIHFGIRAYDSQPDRVRATQADRDNIDNDDHVIIYLDTFNDRRRAFFFGVNPLGVQQDGVRTEGASTPGRMFGGNIDTNPDFVYASRGRLTPDGYEVEVRIPFKSLRFPGSGPQSWGLQIERKTKRTGYTDTWTDVRRASASFLTQAGSIDGLHDLERGVVIEAQPFVTASATGARTSSNGFVRDDVEPDAGVNMRFAFTHLTLDATVNPDFSQVESDAGQVTINERFALFFAEKRPFFLEGIELFGTPNQLVYTRRIVDPLAGGKVTGKLGPFSIAHLSAIDENVDATGREAVFNVTRLRRDLAANSQLGLTYTDRALLDSDAHNRVLSGDARIVFARLYYVETQWAGSWTRAVDDSELSSALWRIAFDRTGRSWGFNYTLNGIGESFRADAGFVNRPGVVTAHGFNRFSAYGRAGALIESATVFFGPTRLWDYQSFGRDGPVEGGESANISARLRGGWDARLQVERTFFKLDPADYARYSVATPTGATPYVPLAEVTSASAQLTVSTPTYERLNASVTVGGGRAAVFDEGAQGRARTASVNVSLRPTDQVRVTATGSYRLLERSRDDSEFARAIIPRIRAEYQPARALFFRAIAEYRAERRAELRAATSGFLLMDTDGLPVGARDTNGLRLDLLTSFEPSPGTVAYLGYGSSLADPGAFEFRRLERMADGFFVKLAYQFRR